MQAGTKAQLLSCLANSLSALLLALGDNAGDAVELVKNVHDLPFAPRQGIRFRFSLHLLSRHASFIASMCYKSSTRLALVNSLLCSLAKTAPRPDAPIHAPLRPASAFPGLYAPFTGHSLLLTESRVRPHGAAPILALGPGNRPTRGSHGKAADILQKLSCGRRRAPPQPRPASPFRQPG